MQAVQIQSQQVHTNDILKAGVSGSSPSNTDSTHKYLSVQRLTPAQVSDKCHGGLALFKCHNQTKARQALRCTSGPNGQPCHSSATQIFSPHFCLSPSPLHPSSCPVFSSNCFGSNLFCLNPQKKTSAQSSNGYCQLVGRPLMDALLPVESTYRSLAWISHTNHQPKPHTLRLWAETVRLEKWPTDLALLFFLKGHLLSKHTAQSLSLSLCHGKSLL